MFIRFERLILLAAPFVGTRASLCKNRFNLLVFRGSQNLWKSCAPRIHQISNVLLHLHVYTLPRPRPEIRYLRRSCEWRVCQRSRLQMWAVSFKDIDIVWAPANESFQLQNSKRTGRMTTPHYNYLICENSRPNFSFHGRMTTPYYNYLICEK